MARKQTIVFTQNEDGTQTFKVGGQSVTFHPDMASASNRIRAELHGWKQRIADKAALGKDATDQQKFDAISAIIGFYEGGGEKWDMDRVGGARKSEFDWTVQALADVQDTDIDTILERLDVMAEKKGVTPEAIAKRLSTSADVAKRIAELKAGPVAGEDADDMMAELMAG